MRGPYRIEAYAIVSADGMITDETEKYPKSFRFDADGCVARRSVGSVVV
jgi:hypothetical protein